MGIKKIAIILSILLIFLQVQAQQLDPEYNYDKFMKHFGRNYEGEEKQRHQQIFNANYLELMARKLNGQDVVVNDFLDWDNQQKQRFMNYKPQSLNIPLSTRPLKSSGLFASPLSFDWRKLGRVTSPKSQGSCGSCYAFASTGAYQSALAIQTNGTLYNLAQQYAVQCDTQSSGCDGGYPSASFYLYNSTGIPLQNSYPYKANSTYYGADTICNSTYNIQQNNSVKLNSTVSAIYHYSNLTTQQIQQDLLTYGPLPVGVFASNSAFLYVGPTGLIDKCPIGGSDHAVLLVGYNSTHWFIKNSWGTNWADSGFGYVLKTNDCNLRLWVDVLAVSYPYLPSPSPSPAPTPSAGYTTLTINMTDSGNNGWEGTIISFMQNGVITGSFGKPFKSGGQYGPVYVSSVKNQTNAQIVATQCGRNTNQIGFNIYNLEGTLIFSYNTGLSFSCTGNSSILGTICPTFGCTTPSLLPYYITITDSYGDGWNGNSIGLRQNNSITYFGYTFTNGNSLGPFQVNLIPNLKTDIVVYTLGNKTQQVGLVIRTYHGYIVYQRTPGTVFYSNTLLGSFTPSPLNFAPINMNAEDNSLNNVQSDKSNEESLLSQTKIQNILIAIIAIGATQLLILLMLIFSAFKIYRTIKHNYNNEIETKSNSEKDNKITVTEGSLVNGQSKANRNYSTSKKLNLQNNISQTKSIQSSATVLYVDRL